MLATRLSEKSHTRTEPIISYVLFLTEDFNKRIMSPDLTTEELESLHKEATDLYDTYFRSNAKHKVNVNQDIAMDIFKSK